MKWNERMKWWKDERMKGWKDERMKGWKDERMKGWKDERMKGWKVEGWEEGKEEGKKEVERKGAREQGGKRRGTWTLTEIVKPKPKGTNTQKKQKWKKYNLLYFLFVVHLRTSHAFHCSLKEAWRANVYAREVILLSPLFLSFSFFVFVVCVDQKNAVKEKDAKKGNTQRKESRMHFFTSWLHNIVFDFPPVGVGKK
jgi:hypothetical protein